MNNSHKEIFATYLKSNNIVLSDNDIQEFLNICTYKKLKNKEILLALGDTKARYYFILNGVVRGYKIEANGQQKNYFLRADQDFVGDPSQLFNTGKESANYFFESVLETEVIEFDLLEFENLIKKQPNLSQIYIVGLKATLKILIYRITLMVNSQPEERYELLLESNPKFFKTAFNKHIANYLGITPVSLSRIIKRKKEK